MIRSFSQGPIRGWRMARSVFGRSVYHTAAYWVDGVLFDSGCAHTADALSQELRTLPIERVLLTHCHEDHIGGAGLLHTQRGVPLHASQGCVRVLAAPRERQRLPLYRRLLWGYPTPAPTELLGDVVETEGHRWQVIPTPGHCPHHVAFFEPDRGWLFCGDAFAGGRMRELWFGSSAWQTLRSLRKLAELDATLLLPGSGTVYDRPREALLRKASELEELASRVQEERRAGRSPREIRRRVLGRERRVRYITQGEFCSQHLVDSLLWDPR